MWERFKRWLYIEYYWWRNRRGRTSVRSDTGMSDRGRNNDYPRNSDHWHNSGSGYRHKKVGKRKSVPVIMLVLVGVVFFVLLSKLIASIYRSFIPFVPGPQIADAYWASIASALKLSLVLIGILAVLVFIIFMKITKRGKKK